LVRFGVGIDSLDIGLEGRHKFSPSSVERPTGFCFSVEIGEEALDRKPKEP
jgi:hypothetical protein